VLASFTTRDGLVHDRVTCLAEHPDGTVWIGTAGGLSRLDRTRWAVLPQWSTAVQDLPDVAISQEGIRAIPELPSEGDDVTFNVTVANPSRISAIATIALMSDDGGRPSLVLDTAIAYTVAGGCYTVLLKWIAVGGEVPLWIVADPDGRVPESDRRNNLVAFGLHVNRPPRISDISVTYNGIAPWSYHTVGNFSITIRYSDEDGDPARSLLATGHNGFHGEFSFDPIAGPGDFKVGRFYRCDVWASSGDNNYTIKVNDGMRQTNASVVLHFNFRINVTGIDPGSTVDGARTIRASVVGTWEGNTVEELSVYIDNGTGQPPVEYPWVALPELRSTRSGENLTIDFAGTPDGKYDLLVLAIDDRGLAASTRITGVIIVHASESNPSWTWAAVLLMGMLGLGVIALMAARRRSSP